MNLREKPKKSAKVEAKKRKIEESTSGPETPPKKPIDLRQHQSPADLSLEARASRDAGIVVRAMQGKAQLTMVPMARSLHEKMWNVQITMQERLTEYASTMNRVVRQSVRKNLDGRDMPCVPEVVREADRVK